MRGEPMVLGAISKLYAAALAREDWSSVLGEVRDAFAGHHVILSIHDFGSGQVPFFASAGLEEQHCERILSEESWRMASPIFGAIQPGTALPRGALCSDSEFARSAFYNEVLRPARGFHSVGAFLRGPGSLMANVNICRPPYAAAYDAPDAAALQTMLPHIAMALEVQARITAAGGRSRSLEGLLDRFAVAALVSDRSARPSFANARAQTLLAAADGLALSPTGLVAATPALTQELHAGIARVAAGNGDGRIAPVRLHLQRPSRRPALRVTLTPASGLDPDGAPTGSVAVLVTEPDAPPPVDKEALAETFHLTRREADVACLLAGGADLPAIADALDLGIGTIRFHLKHVFQKTGTANQAALVALARGFIRLDPA
jgi:DNA-binding CsgD family transcriptional regulator